MTNRRLCLTLSVLPDALAICHLEPGAQIPHWALASAFLSITRTADELSIVCSQASVPADTRAEFDWRCLQVQGPLALSLVGVLASLSETLARAGVSIFAVSTYNTDYVLVKQKDLPRAITALSVAGHTVRPSLPREKDP